MGTVDVTVGELPNSLVISKFAVTQNTDGSVTADYKVTDSPDEIYVEIFADTDSEGFDGTCVYSEYMDKKGTVSFDLDSLSSGEYHFISVYLWMESISGRTVTELSVIRIRMIHRR